MAEVSGLHIDDLRVIPTDSQPLSLTNTSARQDRERQCIAIHAVAAGTRSDSARGLVLQNDDRVPAVRAILGGEVSSSNCR